ncbi:uncharacterized protein LOC142819521 isoform X2 [Pelodiscus sinensis]|uniref:uncharacterized protein LOC142819521 isoform X2 n=1 Tax=Pelodiscus sinensis TaxID=13735 RepID=UPI003F6A8612
MGDSPCHGCPSSGTCCLDFQDTIVLLVALILLVQVALKIMTVICCQLWRLLLGFGGVFVTKPLPSPPANSTIRKPRCPAHDLKPCGRRSVHRELPFLRRCLLCPWEPVRLTMDVNLHRDPPRRHQDAPLCRHDAPRRYHNCTCPRAASAPSAVPRESSSPKQRPATVSCGTEARRGSGVRFRSASREELASSAAESQRQRPTKVYIYPVHPETPPASRDPSPGRRELRWKEDAATPAEGARQSQDMATNTSDGEAEKPAPPSGHARYFKAPEPSTQDWVYRPIKGPQWKRNQVG